MDNSETRDKEWKCNIINLRPFKKKADVLIAKAKKTENKNLQKFHVIISLLLLCICFFWIFNYIRITLILIFAICFLAFFVVALIYFIYSRIK